MSKKEKFKYKAHFDCAANLTKNDFMNGSFISKASVNLTDLKNLLPDQKEINENSDFLYTCFNAAVVNLVNANDDGILTDTGLAIASKFKQRPMNIDHNRNYIIGCIIDGGFSTFGENKLVSKESLMDTKDPFNISLASIVWKVADEFFAQFIVDSANEKSWCYESVATSWELGFNEYNIAIGSKKLSDAEIITDEKQIREMSKYLRAAGGTGFMNDGTPVYRIIVGDAKPLGCGFTSNPAAAVKGVAVTLPEDEDDMDEEEIDKKKCKASISVSDITEVFSSINKELAENTENLRKTVEIISQNKKGNVTPIKSMKFKSIDEVCENLAEASSADVRSFFQEAIKDANDKFAEAEKQKKEKEDALAEAAKDALQTKAELDKVHKELADIQAALAEKERQETFNSRMAELSETFTLDDAACKIVAKRISAMSNEEYTEWRSDEAPIILKAYAKQEPKSKEVPNTEVNLEDSLKEAKANVTFIPNADGSLSDSEKEEVEKKRQKIKKSFSLGEGIVLS